jgi:hypothetical protein
MSFIFLCLVQCFYLNEYIFEVINDRKEIVMIEHVISTV